MTQHIKGIITQMGTLINEVIYLQNRIKATVILFNQI